MGNGGCEVWAYFTYPSLCEIFLYVRPLQAIGCSWVAGKAAYSDTPHQRLGQAGDRPLLQERPLYCSCRDMSPVFPLAAWAIGYTIMFAAFAILSGKLRRVCVYWRCCLLRC